MRPVWTQLVEEYNGDGIILLDHDRDTSAGQAFANRHRLLGQPALVVYSQSGELLHAEYGPYSGAELREVVEGYRVSR